jgi:hypothetical protein
MDKKAFFMGFFLDIWGWIIFFVGMVVWFLIFTLSSDQVTIEVDAVSGYTQDPTTLIAILETPVSGSTTIADHVRLELEGRSSQLKDEMDRAVNSIYGRADKVCWKLWQEDNLLAQVECTGEKQELLNQEVPFPRKEGKTSMRLAVLGYQK